MSTEENKAVVRRYLEEILSTGHLELADTLFTPTMIQRVQRVVGNIRKAFPDFHVTIEEQIAEGDKVVTRWTAHGTQLGQWGDFPPTGKPVTWKEIYIMRLVDGKIAEAVRENNYVEMIEQVGGKIVPPEQANL